MVLTYDRKQLLSRKKGTVVWPTMFFGGFKLQPEKNTTGKKSYSRLADGGSSDLAGTLRPDKKGTVVWLAMFFEPPEKNMTEKKRYSRLTNG